MQCRKVYRFRLEPNVTQALELERTASVSRFVYNWALDLCQTHYTNTGKSKPWSEASSELTKLKQQQRWLYGFDSQMMQQSLADLERAYTNFFAHRAKFPKFKKKKSARQSFRIPQRVRVESGKVYIPSVGYVRVRQSQEIDLKTKSATFKRTATGKWFVTLVAAFDIPDAKNPASKVVGFDAVLEPPLYLVGSDGSEVRAPRYYRRMEKKLRRAQRHLSRCQKASRNRSQAKVQVARIHERIANLRSEFLHQLSPRTIESWDAVCFEDLSLKSLAKTKHAKSWLDASFGEFLRQIEYKAQWLGKHFIQIGRFFPSSKLCSECGYKNDHLSLSDREWTCPACKKLHLRDFNAATNIRREGMRLLAAGSRRGKTPTDCT